MAQARTIEQVRRLAERETGLTLELYRGRGYFYFVYNETDADGRTTRHESYSVYTCHLSSLTTEQWADEARAFATQIRSDS